MTAARETEPSVVLFGALVRRQREALHLTLRDLHSGTGVAFNSVSRIERGIGDVWLSSAVKLATVLDIELCDLTHGAPCSRCGNCPPAGFTCNKCMRGEVW